MIRASTDAQKRAVIIEDDTFVAGVFEQALRRWGWTSAIALDGDQGLALVLGAPPELVLLDLILPTVHGLQVCKTIRASGLDMAVIVVSACPSVEERLEAFSMGADDFLSKPPDIRELQARIEACTRRGGAAVRLGDVHLDAVRSRRAVCGERKLGLTPTEFDLRFYFMRNPERVTSIAELARMVWNHDSPLASATYKVQIGNLRRKLAARSSTLRISCVRGKGYVLTTLKVTSAGP
jgi:two-component system, OmpR family, response regulator MprA